MTTSGGDDSARRESTGGREAARSLSSRLRRLVDDLAAGNGPFEAGPWRVAVEETSMLPALEPGDWLLVDPTTCAVVTSATLTQ